MSKREGWKGCPWVGVLLMGVSLGTGLGMETTPMPGAARGGFPGMFMNPAQQALQDIPNLLKTLNVTDRASLTAALALLQSEKTPEAEALLEKLASGAPDSETVGCARLIQGRHWQASGQEEKALKAFAQVSGRAAPYALASLLKPCLANNDAKAMLKAFSDLLTIQKTPRDRCRLLRALVEVTEGTPFGGGVSPGPRAELLLGAAALIPAKEAEDEREAVAKEEMRLPMLMNQPAMTPGAVPAFFPQPGTQIGAPVANPPAGGVAVPGGNAAPPPKLPPDTPQKKDGGF